MSNTPQQAKPRTLALDLDGIVSDWLDRFGVALNSAGCDSLRPLFAENCWWRDLLAITWDLRTLEGIEKICSFAEQNFAGARLATDSIERLAAPRILERSSRIWIEALFTFETGNGNGSGVLRLTESPDGVWRAWTLLTALDELKGQERRRGPRRPIGIDRSRTGPQKNWLEQRRSDLSFVDREPEVLIIGSGQGGLTLAANLSVLGIESLIIERNEAVGDNWRKRYSSLVLHDPVWVNHLPFMEFPDTWPIYIPKDKLANWLECYASSMELNVWTHSEVQDGTYDDENAKWTVNVRRSDGSTRTLRPRHVVIATGNSGEAKMPSFDGSIDFAGEFYHSSQHRNAEAKDGQRVVIVGACNSAHDIAKDFYEHGAQVTMIQRSSTYVISQKHGGPARVGALYREGGPPTAEADLLYSGFPNFVHLEFEKDLVRRVGDLDRELLTGLERVGFQLDTGPDGTGLLGKALERGGGYYIDVGCSQLIADGKIKVVSGVGVRRMSSSGVELDDGTFLEASTVVAATGFLSARENLRNILGDDVADKCQPVGGLDAEGEIRSTWRQSGHPGLWFMGGSLQLARIYSKYLALQILAIETGHSHFRQGSRAQ